jgi:hypothetical protein
MLFLFSCLGLGLWYFVFLKKRSAGIRPDQGFGVVIGKAEVARQTALAGPD